MKAGGLAIPLVTLAACAAVVGGLLYWGHEKALKGMAQDDPGAPPPTPIGPFPILPVGTVIMVDTAAASLPPPFSSSPQFPGTVDMVLSDPLLVSATFGVTGVKAFSGTIPRSSIVKILAALPPGLNPAQV